MQYPYTAIPNNAIPEAKNPLLQHLLDTYVSETNKVASVWRAFGETDLDFKPHPRSSAVRDILKHQLLSERRFFGQFLGTPEPPADQVLPENLMFTTAESRLVELAVRRLPFFAAQTDQWWLEVVPFFDVQRERIWIFWRRVLHTAHHRTQLAVYQRMLNKPVPAVYGLTADQSWQGADPTHTMDAAGRG